MRFQGRLRARPGGNLRKRWSEGEKSDLRAVRRLLGGGSDKNSDKRKKKKIGSQEIKWVQEIPTLENFTGKKGLLGARGQASLLHDFVVKGDRKNVNGGIGSGQ